MATIPPRVTFSVLMTPTLVRLTHRYAVRAFVVCAIGCVYTTPAVAQDNSEGTPTDATKPFAAWSESVHSMRDSLVSLARAQVGTRYSLGGQSPERGFDCSGLVRYVMSAIRIDLPRTARQQATAGLSVRRDTSRLRPGDLLTFSRDKRDVSHVGIYIGGGRYVHASSVAGQVIESDIDRAPAPRLRAWRGARRVMIQADSARG